MRRPRFDIILPTIGRDSLGLAIESVLAQFYENWILHVVFDRGRIGEECEQQYIKRFTDERIKWYRLFSDNNFSGTDARNYAIAAGRAPWIAYIDDDDAWLNHHLRICTEWAVTSYNLVHTRGRMVRLRRKHPRTSKYVRKLTGFTTDEPTTVGMAHSRQLFSQTGGWQPVDNHDHLLFAEMTAEGARVKLVEEITYEFLR